MSSTLTLLELRNMCKQRSDMSGSVAADQFIPDLEWNAMINSSIAEYAEIPEFANVGFYLTSSQFTLTASQPTVSQPTDYLYLALMEWSVDGSASVTSWTSIPETQLKSKNSMRGARSDALSSYYTSPGRSFYQHGHNWTFVPEDDINGTYKAWYYFKVPELVNDTDVLDDYAHRWYEYIVVDVAIKAKDKEESDVQVLMAQKQALRERILRASVDRNLNQPVTVGGGRAIGGWWDGDWDGM